MNNGSTANGRTTSSSRQGPSSSKNKLATNKPRNNSTALVATLIGAFSGRCTFTISSSIVNRQSSPELMKVKEKVKGIPAIEFRTLSAFNQQIQDNSSKIQNFRREIFLNRAFFLNEPKPKQVEEAERIVAWVENQKDNFGSCGDQSIDSHAGAITACRLWIMDEADKVNSKIRAIYTLREHTEYWQGFWDAIKENVLPDFSGGKGVFEPLLGLVNWVAELITTGIVYNCSWEREKFLEVLSTWEDMLTRDHNLILATLDEVTNYGDYMADSQGLWTSEVGFVWDMKRLNFNLGGAVVKYDTSLQNLEKAERRLSLTLKPFAQALREMYPLFGPGISVERNTKNFCEHVPYISIYLRSLLTAKGIFADSQAERFEEKVYDLARIIYGRLETINELCAQWSKSIDPGELSTFIEKGNPLFIRETDRVIQAIESMLQTETKDSKEMEALKKRTEWDRRYKSWNWDDRPLVTSASACDVLKDLEAIIDVIYCLSVSTGTGTNMVSIGGTVEVRSSNVEFNHSNSLLNEFFNVLRDEIQRGSMGFLEKRVKEQTETKKSRGGLFKRQWKKWRGAKPAAPMEELGLT